MKISTRIQLSEVNNIEFSMHLVGVGVGVGGLLSHGATESGDGVRCLGYQHSEADRDRSIL